MDTEAHCSPKHQPPLLSDCCCHTAGRTKRKLQLLNSDILIRAEQISSRRIYPVKRDLHLAGSLRTICVLCLWYMNVVRNCPLNFSKAFHMQTMKEKLPVNYCSLQLPFCSSGKSLAVFQFPLHPSLPEYFHLWCLQKTSYPAFMQDQPMRKCTKYFWSTLNGSFFGIASVIYDPPCYNLLHDYVIFNLLSSKPKEHFSWLLFITVYWMPPQ